MNYYIYKGSKKVDSFYLNDYPFKRVHYLDKKPSEKDLEVTNIFFWRPQFTKMFPIRQNSWTAFETEEKANNYLQYAKNEIQNDERFSEQMKGQLLKYLQTFKVGK